VLGRQAGQRGNSCSASIRTVACASVRFLCAAVMITIRAEDVRIPRHAREAVARHGQVTVMNRERPAFVIVHPDDTPATPPAPPRTAVARGTRHPRRRGAARSRLRRRPGSRSPQRRARTGRSVGTLLDTTVFIEFERAVRRLILRVP
jgi:hypothetical protein